MTKRVLCIEDQSQMIDLLCLVLQRADCEVIGALGGKAGLEQARALQPDLILLDLMMPELDGWEVFRQLKADPVTQHIPVIVVSARSEGVDQVLGLRIAEADDYITKPFGPMELLERVNRVLARPQA
jgi:DNA-binding response OmpR family regulator